jgi:cytochrome b561
MPVSGWLLSSAGGVSVVWFGVLPLPDLVPRHTLTFGMLRTLHHWLAWTLIAVLALHVAAVVHHDLLRRDGIFRRMSPFAR